MLLETQNLSRQFGGIRAVRGVSLGLTAGEIRAIIGPNGAGKTTLVSAISGRIRPTSGRILFKNEDITTLKAWQRAKQGIVYTFQITSIFQNLTCHDNVALSVQRRLMTRIGDRLRLDTRRLSEEVATILKQVGLGEDIDRRASELPYGHQRLLEVAMGLALVPELLIMDEPTQGLSNSEIASFCNLTKEIASHVTVLLIEHNMAVVMELADRITVMDNGAVLAEGTPEEIRSNAAVQAAYLGS